jgi:hypothetical protein
LIKGPGITPGRRFAILEAAKRTRSEPVTDQTQDIAEVILHFVESLPPTIGNELLLFVMMYGLDRDSMETEIFIPTIRDELTKTGGMKRMSVTLRIVAALDYLLYRSEQKGRSSLRIVQQHADRLSPDIVARMEASHPLRQRHTEKALADWTKLRSTLITRETLMDYEDILLRRSALGR